MDASPNTVRRRRTPATAAEGCGGGCLGCTGTLAVLVALVAIAVFSPWKRDGKWNGFSEALDDLHPGMTMEEAGALFPANSMFAAEAADDFGEHTWVADPEAVAARVLHVEADELEDLSLSRDGCALERCGGRDRGFGRRRRAREECVPDWSGGVDMYFDEEGRLVGVHEYMSEIGKWRAGWGALHDSRPPKGEVGDLE